MSDRVDLVRTVFAVQLHHGEQRRTEFPLKWLGQLQVKLQDTVYAVGQEILGSPTVRGQVPESVRSELAMSVLPQTLAASYVFMAVPDLEASGSIIQSPRIYEALDQLVKLVAACTLDDEPGIRAQMLAHGARTRGRFKELLEAAQGGGSSLGLYLASASGSLEVARASVIQIRSAISMLDSIEKTDSDVHIQRGILLGFDTVTGAFHLADAATGKSYRGGSSDVVRGQWSDTVQVGSASFVVADLRASRVESMQEEAEGVTYTLEALELRDEGG